MMSRAYHNQNSALRKITAVCTIVAIAATTFAAVISAQSMKTAASKSTARLTQDERSLHVLNRLGFGARPGDVERVKAMGLDRYIDQQLHPEKINDSVADAKVKNLDVLQFSTPELYAKFPQPGQILRQLQKSGNAPPELAAAIDSRKNGQQAVPNTTANAPKTDDNAAMT